MEWHEVGQLVSEKLTDLEPVRVLYEYDGPRIFICNDEYGDALLAYLCDETSDTSSFVVVPFNSDFEQRLTTGSITLYEALSQPRIWLAIVDNDWKLQQLRRIKELDELPSKKLPRQDAVLWPHLRPILAVRASGSGDAFGGVLGSVVRDTVERAEDALRKLLNAAQQSAGTSVENLKRLYDLPAQRLAFGSFEISFRSPFADAGAIAPEEIANASALYAEAGRILQEGVRIADNGTINNSRTRPNDRQKLAVEAAQRLAPGGKSAINSLELSGRIIGPPTSSPLVLGKRTHDNAQRVLAGWKALNRMGPVQHRGIVRQIRDSKPYRFIVETADGNEVVFDTEDESLWNVVAEQIRLHKQVVASGVPFKKTARYIATAVHPAT